MDWLNEKTMPAVCLKSEGEVHVQQVEVPGMPPSGHLLLRMEACGINPGDRMFVKGGFDYNTVPLSRHGICGVTGAGTVLEVGDDLPREWVGRKVAVYRALRFSDHLVGVWAPLACVHRLHCMLLPEGSQAQDYSSALLNCITAYSFLRQARQRGHDGIICTAGSSATGMAMQGFCLLDGMPALSLVRGKESEEKLNNLGIRHVISRDEPDFASRFQARAAAFKNAAVFDGVGGNLLSDIVPLLPPGASIYAYGLLGGSEPFRAPTLLFLMRGLSLQGFSNYATETVTSDAALEEALDYMGRNMSHPCFQTRIGQTFALEQAEEALRYTSSGGRAVFVM